MDSDISDAVVARLLRAWLFAAKQDGIDFKNIGKAPKEGADLIAAEPAKTAVNIKDKLGKETPDKSKAVATPAKKPAPVPQKRKVHLSSCGSSCNKGCRAKSSRGVKKAEVA